MQIIITEVQGSVRNLHELPRPNVERVRLLVCNLRSMYCQHGSLNAEMIEELTGRESPYEPSYLAIKYVLNVTFGVGVFPRTDYWGISTISIHFQGRRRDDVWLYTDPGLELEQIALILVSIPREDEGGELFVEPYAKYV